MFTYQCEMINHDSDIKSPYYFVKDSGKLSMDWFYYHCNTKDEHACHTRPMWEEVTKHDFGIYEVVPMDQKVCLYMDFKFVNIFSNSSKLLLPTEFRFKCLEQVIDTWELLKIFCKACRPDFKQSSVKPVIANTEQNIKTRMNVQYQLTCDNIVFENVKQHRYFIINFVKWLRVNKRHEVKHSLSFSLPSETRKCIFETGSYTFWNWRQLLNQTPTKYTMPLTLVPGNGNNDRHHFMTTVRSNWKGSLFVSGLKEVKLPADKQASPYNIPSAIPQCDLKHKYTGNDDASTSKKPATDLRILFTQLDSKTELALQEIRTINYKLDAIMESNIFKVGDSQLQK